MSCDVLKYCLNESQLNKSNTESGKVIFIIKLKYVKKLLEVYKF